jgi:hypothetical protein
MAYTRIRTLLRNWIDWKIEAARMRNRAFGTFTFPPTRSGRLAR